MSGNLKGLPNGEEGNQKGSPQQEEKGKQKAMPQRKFIGKASRFCFTVNNWTEDQWQGLVDGCGDAKSGKKLRCLMMGAEVGAGGTAHIQGYAETWTRDRYTTLARHFGGHWENAYGPPSSCVAYTLKDTSKRFTFGDPTSDSVARKGKKKDAEEEDAAAASKKKWQDIIQKSLVKPDYDGLVADHPEEFMRLKLYKEVPLQHPAGSNYSHQFWWGESGAGKTRSAREYAEIHGWRLFVKSCDKWWDGYKGEEVVVVNEITPDMFHMLKFILIWTDEDPFPVCVKGGRSVIRPLVFIFTSNYSLAECFPQANAYQKNALRRRLLVAHFDKPLAPAPISHYPKEHPAWRKRAAELGIVADRHICMEMYGEFNQPEDVLGKRDSQRELVQAAVASIEAKEKEVEEQGRGGPLLPAASAASGRPCEDVACGDGKAEVVDLTGQDSAEDDEQSAKRQCIKVERE